MRPQPDLLDIALDDDLAEMPVSASAKEQMQAARNRCKARDATLPADRWIPPMLDMEEVTQLAAGIVPRTLQAAAMATLDWEDHLLRNSQKPSPKPARRPNGDT
jgi:hypothetical protein